LLLGTATILMNLGGFLERTDAGLEAEWPRVLAVADQAND
jgi:hypothetical protein